MLMGVVSVIVVVPAAVATVVASAAVVVVVVVRRCSVRSGVNGVGFGVLAHPLFPHCRLQVSCIHINTITSYMFVVLMH